ncbi:MAG TPA: DUF1080 domain-containing protein [Tepidisphaeraceae bacterium]|nr:DUF1080 domain-containing protein [Tepidisphaeraceae bacterium]
MKPTRLLVLAITSALSLTPAAQPAADAPMTVDQGLIGAPAEWEVHDRKRPQPPVVTPATPSTQDAAGAAPSDAIVLFDGKNLDLWESTATAGENKGKRIPAAWKVENGYFEIVPKTGQLVTKDQYPGDLQVHVEFRMPDPAKGKDQDRGNSGLFIMGRYEFQVLDNYQAETYADGMVGAFYGQYPPQVNAARKPGEWQAYDIIFHGPRFDTDGKLTRPARATVLLNGVLVQDNVELKGPTSHMKLAEYKKHPPTGPITLQDHGHPVRFRNIWIRPITDKAPVAPTKPGVKH